MNEKTTVKKMNAGPLGLLGFGLTTVLLNLHNSGLYGLNTMIIAMGIAVGGFMQIVAGILEFKNANNFGGTAFFAYGAFWLSLVLVWIFPPASYATSASAMGYYFLVWGLFTAVMFIGTFRHNVITRIVFGSLLLLFILLALINLFALSSLTIVAGIVGVFSGLSAIYSASGQILHEEFGKKILPLF